MGHPCDRRYWGMNTRNQLRYDLKPCINGYCIKSVHQGLFHLTQVSVFEPQSQQSQSVLWTENVIDHLKVRNIIFQGLTCKLFPFGASAMERKKARTAVVKCLEIFSTNFLPLLPTPPPVLDLRILSTPYKEKQSLLFHAMRKWKSCSYRFLPVIFLADSVPVFAIFTQIGRQMASLKDMEALTWNCFRALLLKLFIVWDHFKIKQSPWMPRLKDSHTILDIEMVTHNQNTIK